MNTIPPNDFSYYEWLDEVVQQEPAGSLDPELMGPIAAIGIVKGRPFAPDARMKRILTEAAAVANATSRSLFMHPRDPDWYYYPGSAWLPLTLTISGYDFTTPPPAIEGPVRDGLRTPYGRPDLPRRPATACSTPARTSTTASWPSARRRRMRLSGIGSQYLMATMDADKQYFDGARTYRVTLPRDIPAANFWSLTLYDTQTRSMLVTPQRYPRAGSQGYPSPAAEAGRRRLDHGVLRARAAGRGGARQLDPDRARQGLVRAPAPLRPARAVLRQDLAPGRGRAGGLSQDRVSRVRTRSGRPARTASRRRAPAGRSRRRRSARSGRPSP